MKLLFLLLVACVSDAGLTTATKAKKDSGFGTLEVAVFRGDYARTYDAYNKAYKQALEWCGRRQMVLIYDEWIENQDKVKQFLREHDSFML